MPTGTAAEIIVLKSPSLAGDSRINDFVDLARLTVGRLPFGTRYEYALALVALHMITLDSQGGGSSSSSGSGVIGGIKSEKEGDLQRSYGTIAGTAVNNPSDAYFSSTSFGMEYLNLKRSILIKPRNKMVGNFVSY